MTAASLEMGWFPPMGCCLAKGWRRSVLGLSFILIPSSHSKFGASDTDSV